MENEKTFQLWHVYGNIRDCPVRVVTRHVGRPNSDVDYIIVADLIGEETAIYPVVVNNGKEWLVIPPSSVEDADVNRDGEVLPEPTCIDWCRDITSHFPEYPTPSA